MQIRLSMAHGGNGQYETTRTLYDTGSNTQSIHRDKFVGLWQASPTFTSLSRSLLATAAGQIPAIFLPLEVRILKNNGEELSGWVKERGVVSEQSNSPPLSGSGIRTELYFATAPNALQLFVSQTKNGLVRQLPTTQQ